MAAAFHSWPLPERMRYVTEGYDLRIGIYTFGSWEDIDDAEDEREPGLNVRVNPHPADKRSGVLRGLSEAWFDGFQRQAWGGRLDYLRACPETSSLTLAPDA